MLDFLSFKLQVRVHFLALFKVGNVSVQFYYGLNFVYGIELSVVELRGLIPIARSVNNNYYYKC